MKILPLNLSLGQFAHTLIIIKSGGRSDRQGKSFTRYDGSSRFAADFLNSRVVLSKEAVANQKLYSQQAKFRWLF